MNAIIFLATARLHLNLSGYEKRDAHAVGFSIDFSATSGADRDNVFELWPGQKGITTWENFSTGVCHGADLGAKIFWTNYDILFLKKLMKKTIVNSMIIIFFIGLFMLINYLTRNSDEKFIIRDIKSEFKGVVKEKIAKRENLFLDIKIGRENQSDTIIDAGSFISEISIGDSVIKRSNSPYCYRINKKGIKRLPFTYIPKKILENDNFPLLWKDSLKDNWKALVK